MQLAELVRSGSFRLQPSSVYPFVYAAKVTSYTYAPFWMNVIGAPDDSIHVRQNVKQITRTYLNKYAKMESYENCKAQEASFYFDDPTQTVYIHMEHSETPWTSTLGYGFAFGMTDEEVLYIDDYEYLPLIESLPSLERQADIINATKISGAAGNAELLNIAVGDDGPLDFLIDENLYGNDFFVFAYDKATGVKMPRAAFFIEDYTFSRSRVTLDLQDKRKAQNIKIPTNRYDKETYPFLDDGDVGKIIPLAYGVLGEIPLTAINANDRVDIPAVKAQYRMPDGLSDIGSAYVWTGDKTWSPAVNPIADFSTMILTIDNGRDSNGATLKVKLVGCKGIMFSGHSYPADIIRDLNSRFLNLAFTSSNYDITEWTAEAASPLIAADIGFILQDQKQLFDVIFDITNKSKTIFRYEYTPDDRITIRVRDFDRPASAFIQSCDIKNRDELPVETDKSNVFAEVIEKYEHSYITGTSKAVVNRDHKAEVIANYRMEPSLEEPVDGLSFLAFESDARYRALTHASSYSSIPRIAKLELVDYLDLKIFDIIYADMSADDTDPKAREYFGPRLLLVLSVNPNDTTGINSITAQIKKLYPMLDESGEEILFEDFSNWMEE
jgi:hypothetical protein